MTTCLVADDHPAVLQAIVGVLGDSGFDVVATAGRGDVALARLAETRPDIAIVDSRMPGLRGMEVVRDARAQGLETRFVLYTGADEPGLLHAAIMGGVRGLVLKDAPIQNLIEAVRVVSEGGTYVDGALAGDFVPAAAGRVPNITQREREVLRGLANGQTFDAIGKELSISPATVRVHLQKAMARLEASTKSQAVATALRLALID